MENTFELAVPTERLIEPKTLFHGYANITEACKGHSRCDLVGEEKNSEGKCDIKMRDAT